GRESPLPFTAVGWAPAAAGDAAALPTCVGAAGGITDGPAAIAGSAAPPRARASAIEAASFLTNFPPACVPFPPRGCSWGSKREKNPSWRRRRSWRRVSVMSVSACSVRDSQARFPGLRTAAAWRLRTPAPHILPSMTSAGFIAVPQLGQDFVPSRAGLLRL